MKQIQLMMAAGIVLLLSSCGSKSGSGMSAAAQKNLDGMHGVAKAIDNQDFTKLGDYIATDAVDHTDTGDVKGLDNITANFKKYGEMSDNMKSEVVKELADDDYVMSWMKYSGVSKVDEMGMKKGESYTMNAIEVSRCKDGKAVEHWSFMMPSEMMKMMAGSNGMTPPEGDKMEMQKKDSMGVPNN
jgi:predicted SnoaL-like aldol condensation-catalyzing enzyme